MKMRNNLLASVMILCLLAPAFAESRSAQQEPPLFMDFDKISIWGHVYNENGRPLDGIKVEIRLAYSALDKRPEIMGTADILDDAWEYLVRTVGTDVFGWSKTDEKGLYRINGVPRPGAYFLLVRQAEGYLQTQASVVIHKTGAKDFEADIILRARTSAQAKPVPKEAIQRIAKAKEAIAGKKLDLAIEHLQEAIKLVPEFAEAHYNLGILLRQKGKIDEAAGHFLKAIEFHENYTLAIFALGETLQAQNKFPQSNLYLAKYLEISGSDTSKTTAQAHYLIGVNDFNLKQTKEAVPAFSRAIELDPNVNPNAYVLLGNSYLIERDGPNAIKAYRKFIEMYPQAPNIEQVRTVLEKLESMYPDK
jgi:tetratricopeptide (TPR) repeat protein